MGGANDPALGQGTHLSRGIRAMRADPTTSRAACGAALLIQLKYTATSEMLSKKPWHAMLTQRFRLKIR